MKEALDHMKKGKTPGPSGVTSDLLKVGENESITQIAKVALKMICFQGKKCRKVGKGAI